MPAPGDIIVAAAASANAPSAYADQMPKLREFAALPAADPRRGVAWRGVLREELILAFLPMVEHQARRHAVTSPPR